jgi:hypothetical protein
VKTELIPYFVSIIAEFLKPRYSDSSFNWPRYTWHWSITIETDNRIKEQLIIIVETDNQIQSGVRHQQGQGPSPPVQESRDAIQA